MMSEIHESVHLQWRSDVDLNDGEVQRMRITYLNRLTFIANIGIQRGEQLDEQLSTLETEIEEELTII